MIRWESEKYDGMRMFWNPDTKSLYPIILIIVTNNIISRNQDIINVSPYHFH